MPNTDFRITTDALDHPKLVKLERICGKDGVLCLIRLWGFTARYHPKGILNGMTDKDIEIAARWTGEELEFITTLRDLKLVDKRGSSWSIHDWKEHNSYAYYAPERSAQARHAVHVREQLRHQSRSSDRSSEGSSPSPSPSPSPKPSPSPTPPTFESGLVSELFPNREFTPAEMGKQAHALKLLRTIDRKKVDGRFSEVDWPEHVMDILRYMRDDTETRGDWKGWAAVFSSLPRLREKSCTKFINARNSYLRSSKNQAEETEGDRQYHFVDVEAMDREEQEELKRIASRATDTLRPPG